MTLAERGRSKLGVQSYMSCFRRVFRPTTQLRQSSIALFAPCAQPTPVREGPDGWGFSNVCLINWSRGGRRSWIALDLIYKGSIIRGTLCAIANILLEGGPRG
jgi:hypothetical protein